MSLLAALLLMGAASSLPSGPEKKDMLFVLNKSEASVSLLEPGSGREIGKIPVGVGPHEAVASPDGRKVIVCNYGAESPGSSLSVIDVAGRRVEKTIDLAPYHRPHGILYLPDGRRVVVTAEQEQKLLVVDIESGRIESAVDTDQRVSHMVAATRDGKLAFVANIGSGSVSVISLEEKKLLRVVPTGAGAEGIAVHPSGKEVWVTNRSADTVSIVDIEKLEVAKTLPCASFPIRVQITPDGQHALVSCARSGDVAVFVTATREEMTRIPMNEKTTEKGEGRVFGGMFKGSPVPIGILIRPDGRQAYIANTYADTVTVIDLQSWRVIGRLAAGKEPDGLAWVRGGG